MRRHDLVILYPGTPFAFACGDADPGLAGTVREWIDRGHPLVVTRQPAASPLLQLGLSLPARLGRRRLACQVDRGAVATVLPPLAVERCRLQLSASAAQVLDRLAERCAAAGIALGVFGSLAWEAATGEAYRHAASDIDLIVDVSTHAQYGAALAALAEAAARLPCRLDGELRFPDGNAVAWRELAVAGDDAAARVLAKGPATVALIPLGALFAGFELEPAHA